MTTLIRQRSGNDCVLAAIAMAAGKSRWEDLWTEADLQSVIESKGVSNVEHWLERAGYELNKDYVVIYCHNESSIAKRFLWKRKALLTVDSLNNVGGATWFSGTATVSTIRTRTTLATCSTESSQGAASPGCSCSLLDL